MTLIKGALRRVFARSEMHEPILEACRVPVSEVPVEVRAARPKVKDENWVRCPLCKEYTNMSSMQVDHVDPVIPVTSSLVEMDLLDVINRIWCDPSNLQATCKKCHAPKTKLENDTRRANKKAKKIKTVVSNSKMG